MPNRWNVVQAAQDKYQFSPHFPLFSIVMRVFLLSLTIDVCVRYSYE